MTDKPKYDKWLKLLKKGLLITAWVGMLGGLVFALAFVNKQEQELKCKKVNISIYPLDVRFFNRQSVFDVIRHEIGEGKKLIGLPMKEINVSKFEQKLAKQVHIEKADVLYFSQTSYYHDKYHTGKTL
jgi:hypothetical protein